MFFTPRQIGGVLIVRVAKEHEIFGGVFSALAAIVDVVELQVPRTYSRQVVASR